MSGFNGAGVYQISGAGLPYVAATTISSTVANTLNSDVATGLSTTICRDGQSTTTAQIPFAAGLSSANFIDVRYGNANGASLLTTNLTNGAASFASVSCTNSSAETVSLIQRSAAFTPAGINRASGANLTATGAGGLMIATTAVTPIYFAINSVEAARFGSDGSWLVGTNTNGGTLGTAKFAAEATSNGNASVQYTRQSGTGWCETWRADSASGGVANITFNGTTQIGSISLTGGGTGVAYNTSSDARKKIITGQLQNSGRFIDAMNPVYGTWRANQHSFVGLVAQDVMEVSPSSVAKDSEDYLTLNYASPEIIANMIAELKSLRARVAALEAK